MRCGWLFVDEVASSITVARSRGRDERGVIAQEVSYLREGRISHTDAVLADEDIVAVVYEGWRNDISRAAAVADPMLRSVRLRDNERARIFYSKLFRRGTETYA